MRYNISKKNSTKHERIFYEILKSLKIPFKHRWKVGKYEIDFIVKNYAIEINGHNQSPQRNQGLVRMKLTPIHIQNESLVKEKDKLILWLKQIQCSQAE